MKELIIVTESKKIVREITELKYSYTFTNKLGFSVKKEGFETEEKMMDSIRENTEKLKNREIKIVKKDD